MLLRTYINSFCKTLLHFMLRVQYGVKFVMMLYFVIVLMMSTQLSWSYRLDERFELTSTDVRMRVSLINN